MTKVVSAVRIAAPSPNPIVPPFGHHHHRRDADHQADKDSELTPSPSLLVHGQSRNQGPKRPEPERRVRRALNRSRRTVPEASSGSSGLCFFRRWRLGRRVMLPGGFESRRLGRHPKCPPQGRSQRCHGSAYRQ